jgi:hypothetical protein
MAVAAATGSVAARPRAAAAAPTPDAAAQPSRLPPGALAPRTMSMRASAQALEQTLAAEPVAGALRQPERLSDPVLRASVATALAGAPLPRSGKDARPAAALGNWVGPVFWPFAADDLAGFVLWGEGRDTALWRVGASDLAIGLFGVYPNDIMAAYGRHLPTIADGDGADDRHALARLCGRTSGDIAGVPVATLRSTLQLNDDQNRLLDQLSASMLQATRRIAGACPVQVPLTAAERTAIMTQRLNAMLSAIRDLRPALDAFTASLDADQAARLASLPPPQAPSAPAQPATTVAQLCAAQPKPVWPKDAMKEAIGAGEGVRSASAELERSIGEVGDNLAARCRDVDVSTPTQRLNAAETRLTGLRDGLATLRASFDRLYDNLDTVQKADLDTVGSAPIRAAMLAAFAQRAGQAMPGQATAAQGARAGAAGQVAATEAASPPAAAPAPRAEKQRVVRRERAGRRHVARYRGMPGPVRMVRRMLFSFMR